MLRQKKYHYSLCGCKSSIIHQYTDTKNVTTFHMDQNQVQVINILLLKISLVYVDANQVQLVNMLILTISLRGCKSNRICQYVDTKNITTFYMVSNQVQSVKTLTPRILRCSTWIQIKCSPLKC